MNYLVFKRYLTVDEVRLHAANFCKKHLLCLFCAMRAGAKYLQVYKQRLDVVLQETWSYARSWLRWLWKTEKTFRSGSRICVRLSRSIRSSAGMLLKGQKAGRICKAPPVVSWALKWSVGRNLVYGTPCSYDLALQSSSISFATVERVVRANWRFLHRWRAWVLRWKCGRWLFEVFKYALKFSDMELADNWEAFQTLKAKRLVDNFGLFRGVQVPDDLTDDDIDDEFILLLLPLYQRVWFNFVGQGNTAEIMEILGVSRNE